MKEENKKSKKKVLLYYLILAACLLVIAAVTVTVIFTVGNKGQLTGPSIDNPDNPDTPNNGGDGNGGALDEILAKLKDLPLWQLIASGISIILTIAFLSKTASNESKRKKAKKVMEKK